MGTVPPIYRAAQPGQVDTFCNYRKTRRPPGNVPYVVDNLWEWVRPEGYPNRRYAAFASPTSELARKAAGPHTRAYRVEFAGDYCLCQLKGYEDAKYHPEVKTLRRLLFGKIGRQWPSEPMQRKVDGAIGKLFIPCLAKEEVEQIFQENDLLREIRDEIFPAIRYWDDVCLIQPGETIPDPVGEICFEAFDGYYLREE